MSTTITQTPTRWSMYAEYGPRGEDGRRPVIATPGDDFLTTEMNAFAMQVRTGMVRATELYDLIRVVQERCCEAGFTEVHDTEPEWAICDFVNALCDEQGWAHVDRWEFR